jgi:hypothetical protein
LLRHATKELTPQGAVQFLRLFDVSIDRYLLDHRLDNRPVVPLAFATELMAEAAQAAYPDLQVVAVRSLQLMKGIVLDDAPLPVTTTVRPAVHSREDGIVEADVEIATPSMRPPVRYRSVVQLSARPLPPALFDAPVRPVQPLTRSIETAYRDWTFHGPLFQRVTHISGIGGDAMVGTIYSSSLLPVISGVARPEWIIDPFVFDAALQLLLMWSRAVNDKTALPSRFHSFARFGQLSDQALTAYVDVESTVGGHALKSDVRFVDQEGRIIGFLETMEASCSAELNRLTSAGAAE